MKTILVVFMLTISLQATFAQEKLKCFWSLYHEVHVANNLPPNSSPMTVHCFSGDDDLGSHELAVGQEFNWHFCDHFLARTLFVCHLWWDTKQLGFEAYKGTWKKPATSTFHLWAAKSDGIYYNEDKNNQTSLTKKFDWQ
ncbi:hypothetical protein ABFX02_06G191700 [Erythranthe guttata]